tara:strand:- start:3571 stop:4848 length:1278 start_codon:yes stop_codon:yes gene_type:complete
MAIDIGGMLARSGTTSGQLIGGGLANLGAGIGAGLGGMLTRRRERQLKEEETKQAQAQALTTYNQMAVKAGLTPEEASIGVRGLISGQYKNPTQALRDTVETKKLLSSQDRRNYIAQQLEGLGLKEVASDVKSGVYTDAQLGSIISNARQAQSAADQGQEGLEAYVSASNLTDTAFGKAVMAGNLKNIPSNLVGKLATEALQDQETQDLIKNLKNLGTDAGTEAANLLELGVITPTGAKKIIEQSREPTKISTANMKQYYVEGVDKPVWGGDITVGNVERRAYRDPNDPNKIIDLPATARELKDPETGKESRIRDLDLKIASIQLIDNPLYAELNEVDRTKAQLAFASKYNTLLNQEKTNEEALAEAKSYALSKISQITETGWFFDSVVTKFQEMPEFATEEEAEAAGLKKGTVVLINGRKAEIQ